MSSLLGHTSPAMLFMRSSHSSDVPKLHIEIRLIDSRDYVSRVGANPFHVSRYISTT